MSTNTEAIQRLQTLSDNVDILIGVPGKPLMYKVSKATLAAALTEAKPYLTYRAVLTQVAATDPTVTVLENTIGTPITWARQGAGDFLGTVGSILDIPGGGLPDSNSGLWLNIANNQTDSRSYILYENDVESISLYELSNLDSNMNLSIEISIPNPAYIG